MIYIASPYTSTMLDSGNVQREQRQRARAAAWYCCSLIASGINAWSPIAHGHAVRAAAPQLIGVDYACWRDMSREMLDLSHEMHVLKLPGWDRSVGIAAEIQYCNYLHTPIHKIDPSGQCLEILDAGI